jgi:hypothetical protein
MKGLSAWHDDAPARLPRTKLFMECRTKTAPINPASRPKTSPLCPLLGFFGDELAEVGGRAGKHGAAQGGEPRPHPRISECRINFLIELGNDFRAPRQGAGVGVTRLPEPPVPDALPRRGQRACWRRFELNELRGALARIGRTIPTYRNIGIDTAVATIFADEMKTVDAAIKAADLAQFGPSYEAMTGACNDCHKGLEHPFVVIKVPDAANYPDQEFRPQPN